MSIVSVGSCLLLCSSVVVIVMEYESLSVYGQWKDE
jgi:hypothetical protein